MQRKLKPKKSKSISPGTLDRDHALAGQELLEICFFGFGFFNVVGTFMKTLVFNVFGDVAENVCIFRGTMAALETNQK